MHFHNVLNVNKFNFKERFINYILFLLLKLNKFRNIKLVAVSNGIKNDLCKSFNINEKHVEVIYPSIDFYQIDKYEKYNKKSLSISNKYILNIGRLEKQKNHVLLIKLFIK